MPLRFRHFTPTLPCCYCCHADTQHYILYATTFHFAIAIHYAINTLMLSYEIRHYWYAILLAIRWRCHADTHIHTMIIHITTILPPLRCWWCWSTRHKNDTLYTPTLIELITPPSHWYADYASHWLIRRFTPCCFSLPLHYWARWYATPYLTFPDWYATADASLSLLTDITPLWYMSLLIRQIPQLPSFICHEYLITPLRHTTLFHWLRLILHTADADDIATWRLSCHIDWLLIDALILLISLRHWDTPTGKATTIFIILRHWCHCCRHGWYVTPARQYCQSHWRYYFTRLRCWWHWCQRYAAARYRHYWCRHYYMPYAFFDATLMLMPPLRRCYWLRCRWDAGYLRRLRHYSRPQLFTASHYADTPLRSQPYMFEGCGATIRHSARRHSCCRPIIIDIIATYWLFSRHWTWHYVWYWYTLLLTHYWAILLHIWYDTIAAATDDWWRLSQPLMPHATAFAVADTIRCHYWCHYFDAAATATLINNIIVAFSRRHITPHTSPHYAFSPPLLPPLRYFRHWLILLLSPHERHYMILRHWYAIDTYTLLRCHWPRTLPLPQVITPSGVGHAYAPCWYWCRHADDAAAAARVATDAATPIRFDAIAIDEGCRCYFMLIVSPHWIRRFSCHYAYYLIAVAFIIIIDIFTLRQLSPFSFAIISFFRFFTILLTLFRLTLMSCHTPLSLPPPLPLRFSHLTSINTHIHRVGWGMSCFHCYKM